MFKNKINLPLPEGIKEKGEIEKLLGSPFFRLRFPPYLETTFRKFHLEHQKKLIVLSLALGFFLYMSFGILDFLVYKEFLLQLWFIRFALISPIILLSLLYIKGAKKEERVQWALSITLFLTGLSVVLFVIITSNDPSQKYYAGLVLVIFYLYVLLSLRFPYATIAGWTITLAYLLITIRFVKPAPDFLVANSFTLVIANIMGMAGNFFVEKTLRKNFLLTVLNLIEKEKLKELSHQDFLTGLANRRFFNRFLSREWARARRFSHPITLLMLDIDNFKEYNDRLGHQAGDECLKSISRILKDFGRRPADLVARYGGEEFAVILSGTDRKGGMKTARKIKERVSCLRIPHPGSSVSPFITVSIGVCCVIPGEGMKIEDFIGAADKALYTAKSKGKNRVDFQEILH